MQGPVLGVQDIPLEKFHTLIFELPGNRKLKADWIQKYKPLEQKQPDREAIVLNAEKPASKKNSMAGNADLPTEIPSKEDFPEKEIQKENMWKEEIEKEEIQREPENQLHKGRTQEDQTQKNQLHKDQTQKDQMWDEQDQNASRSDSPQQKALMPKSPQQSNNTIPAGKIYETKWEQLCDLFEKIHPFGDEKEYVKISPGDFYVLRESCQHLAHNSFLLHGYYNYRYLILGKKEMGSIDEYMLGVPGIYHDREIMAAKMFGFTGFESTTKECSQGSFGYYMVGVE